MIYLDNNATTRPAPEVVTAMRGALEGAWHNPSSVHRAGQEARRVVELARQDLAELIGARAKDLTFTSGGTEALDLAMRGSLAATSRRVIVTTAVEHSAVRDLVDHLRSRGAGGGAAEPAGGLEVRLAPVDESGVVRLPELLALLPGAGVVVVQWANNETGAVQPVEAICRACVERGVRSIVDGTQWVGKMPTRVGEAGLDCDLLTFSPHKFHGPKGVGVLFARAGTRLAPALHGSQEKGRRGGTENVPGIAGAGAAARLALAWLAHEGPERRAGPDRRTGEIERLAGLRDRFEQAVLDRIPEATVNGPRSSDPQVRLWSTTNIAFPRLEAEALLLAFSERGLCASAGAACSSGSLDPSPVLLAMGIPPERAHGSIRFSISRETTAEELESAVETVVACVDRVRRSGG